MALGWQAKPMLEHVGGAPSATRVQLTQSSVHRLQFGGPACIETSPGTLGVLRGGIASSAAAAAWHPATTIVSASARQATRSWSGRMPSTSEAMNPRPRSDRRAMPAEANLALA